MGLTSADGYKTLLSHLGPDKKVRSSNFLAYCIHVDEAYVVQESSMFLVTLGPRLPGEFPV